MAAVERCDHAVHAHDPCSDRDLDHLRAVAAARFGDRDAAGNSGRRRLGPIGLGGGGIEYGEFLRAVAQQPPTVEVRIVAGGVRHLVDE